MDGEGCGMLYRKANQALLLGRSGCCVKPQGDYLLWSERPGDACPPRHVVPKAEEVWVPNSPRSKKTRACELAMDCLHGPTKVPTAKRQSAANIHPSSSHLNKRGKEKNLWEQMNSLRLALRSECLRSGWSDGGRSR